MRKKAIFKFCRQIFSFALALLLLPSVPISAVQTEQNTEISAAFGERSLFKGLKAWYMKPEGEPTISSGGEGWELDQKAARNYIYIDINDYLMYDLCDESVEIEVDVVDGEGAFLLHYDGYERVDDATEIIECRETGKVKTYTFFIQDAVFKNGLEGADFRISVKEPAYGSLANPPVIVCGVRVRFADTKSPVSLKLSTQNTGNIFFEGQTVSFQNEYTNRTDKPYILKAVYKAVDTENRILWEKEGNISIGANETVKETVDFQIERFGLYWLRVELYNEEEKIYCIRDREFSYVTTNYGKRLNYNVGTTQHSDHWEKYGEVEEVLPLLVNAGYGYERIELQWMRISSQPGHFVLSPRLKKNLELYKKAGVKRTIIVSLRNELYPARDSKDAFNKGDPTPEFLQVYKGFVKELVRKTKDYANSYIIGNEPDHADVKPEYKKPENYAIWAKTAAEAIREEHPDAYILGYGLSTATPNWLGDTIRAGAAEAYDTVDVHLYGNYVTYEQQNLLGRLEKLRAEAKEALGEELPPFWIGETGYVKRRRKNNSNYWISQQFPRLYVYAESSDMVARVMDYAMIDSGFSGYGHIRGSSTNYTNVIDNDLPCGAYREYLTIACWNKNFGGDCEFIESVDKENLRLYKFRRKSDGKYFIAMWTLNGKENITLSLGANELSYMDILGNEEMHYSDDGKFTFNLSEDMTYAIGDFKDFKLCEEQKFSFSALEIASSPGSPKALTVTENGSRSGFTVETEDIWYAKTASVENNPDGTANVNITIQKPEKTLADKYLNGEAGRTQLFLRHFNDILDVVRIKVKKDGKLYCTAEIPVKELGSVDMGCDIFPESIENVGNWNAYFTLENTSAENVTGDFAIISPALWAENAKAEKITLAPGEKKVLTYNVPDTLKGEDINLEAKVIVPDGREYEYSAVKNTMCAVYTDTPPVIDGVLDENEWVLDAAAPIKSDTYNVLIKTESYSGSNDLSGSVSTMWDKENLYMAVTVNDDVHKQAYKDSGTWKADGLQIGFTVAEKPQAFTHLFAALSDDGYITRWLFASEDSSNEKGMPSEEDYELKVSRNGTKTVYEMRISRNLFMPVVESAFVGDGANISFTEIIDDTRQELKGGSAIRFSVLVNDDDGAGRKGYVQYGSNISGGTYNKFKSLYLYGGPTE